MATMGVAVLAVAVVGTGQVAGAAPATTGRTVLVDSAAPAVAQHAHMSASVAATASVSFDLTLALANAAGAAAEFKAVSDPTSASYHHYLSDAAWIAEYAPTQAEVTAAQTWLRASGFTVGAVPKDRLFVPASGTAAQVEKAFGVSLGYYTVNGKTTQLTNAAPSIPSSLAGTVAGVVGLNQHIATPAASADPPPAGFRNPPLCSSYWGQKVDTVDSAKLYAPYTKPLPYDICGYTPSQLRGAYGLTASVAKGNNGAGVAVAIVDAYDSPTLLADAQRYYATNDPTHPLRSSQFVNLSSPTFANDALCSASGWYAEQSLDVEAVHAMAPGATIAYFGASDCINGLLTALQSAVTSGASIVTDSWGDTVGDLLDDAATKTAYDNTFMLAGTTGVSVLFSSGDSGDNFASFGLTAPDYPPSSPFVTAVGGTSLEVNAAGQRAAEYGWSAGKQIMCEPTVTNCGSQTVPTGALAFNSGSGGGTSYYYNQPYYQAPVVPTALAEKNAALYGPVPLRVVPDISMDADAQTGMLIGLTQTFPTGAYYDQFKEGGTSLASPLLAGVIADADQAAGVPLGFLNPVLYKADLAHPGAFTDITAPPNPNAAATVRVDFQNLINPQNGYFVSVRALDYQGPETYCDATNNCATRPVTLTTAPGYDSMTGIGSVGSQFISVLSKY